VKAILGVFLREDVTSYVVTIPLFQVEVLLAPGSALNLPNMSVVPRTFGIGKSPENLKQLHFLLNACSRNQATR
jgi:hypothetical protein